MSYSVSEMLPFEKKEVDDLLQKYNLTLDGSVDYTATLKWDHTFVGTCSLEGNVLKGFVIKPCYQGGSGALKILDHMVGYLFDQGIFQAFAYTRSENVSHFKKMGFACVHDTGDVSLLSYGGSSIETYLKDLKLKYDINTRFKSASIVMNGNPFTKGHRYLIEKACEEEEQVIVFVVEENKSTFPFDVRFKLIKEGTCDLKNVVVVPGGPFIVSQGTFPSYFIRDGARRSEVGARLDAEIFTNYISKGLNIARRYVGTEPFCETTRLYNQVLFETLKKGHVDLIVIDRKTCLDHAISASEVRKIISLKDISLVEPLVPKTTFNYLIGENLQELLDKRGNNNH